MLYLMNTTDPSTLLTTAEVAALAERTTQTVRRAVDAGHLTPLKRLPGVNGSYLFTPSAVEEWLNRRTAAA